MSDSGSGSGSSSSGSASSRRASPQPENEPGDDAIDSNQKEGSQDPEGNTAGDDAALDTDLPEPTNPYYDPYDEKLFVLWEEENPLQEDDENQDKPPPGPDTHHIDFVLVGGAFEQWTGHLGEYPGSGSSSWLPDFARDSSDLERPDVTGSCRVIRYHWDSSKIFRGRQSQQAIHQIAVELLHRLKDNRQTQNKKRLIYFIAHDIGGIIVKDALTTAALEENQWRDISEMTRVLIFNGCPHRSLNRADLENRLSRFLYEKYTPSFVDAHFPVSTIPGFSEAIDRINGLFIESKVPLRSWIFSVHAESPMYALSIHSAFDSFSGTLGLPLERRISDPTSSGYSPLIEKLNQLKWDIVKPIEATQYRQERTLLALASPVYPLKTSSADRFNPLDSVPAYQTWLQSLSPRILYIHGDHSDYNVQEVAEKVFYSLEGEAEHVHRRAMVLYFSFDRWDVRCDSIRDMIATFIAQITNHFPNLTKTMKYFFNQLDREHGWTETDLIQFFERFRTTDEIEQTMIVINHFDECTAGSRKRFLDSIIDKYDNDETPWKIVVTSHKPGALLDELSGEFCVPIDLSTEQSISHSYHYIESDFEILSKQRSDLISQEDKVRQELDLVDKLEHHLRHVVYEQVKIRPEWPAETSVEEIFSSIDFSSNGSDDDAALKNLLDFILKGVPDQAMLRRLLTWLVYAVRPMTIWELAIVLSLGTQQDRGDVSPTLSALERLTHLIEHSLAGIVEIDHNEVKFQLPRLQSIMLVSGASEKQYIWDEIRDTAQFEIAKLCLDYLSRANVLEHINKALQVKDSTTSETPTFLVRTNFVSYAAQAWAHHHALSTPSPDLSGVISQPDLVQTLAQAHWALSNPITRNATCLKTLFPIFAGLGKQDVVEPESNSDAFQGLLEACRKRQNKVVQDLLDKYTFDESQLWEALKATSSSGKEDMLLSMLEYVLSKTEKPTEIEWPPVLIHRAAWLNLDRFVEKVLVLGCFPDTDEEYAEALGASPLYEAASNGYVKIVQLLLTYGANAKFEGNNKKNPMHVAAARGHTEVVRLLAESGKLDIDCVSEQNYTPFYIAAVWGHYKTAELLLDKGADPNMGIPFDSRDDSQWSPLTTTVEDGFVKCVKLILDRGGNPNICGPSGPPLWWAVYCGRLEILNMLLAAGADPKSDLIKTPLLAEVMGYDSKLPNLPMLDRLLELDLDVNAKDAHGTPILTHTVNSYPREFKNGETSYISCYQKDFAIGQLLDKGADPNLTDANGQAALLYVASNTQDMIAEVLVQKGANPDQKNNEGVTPLLSGLNSPYMTRILLENKASVDLGIPGGWTCLTSAAYFGHTESVQLLLDYGASVDLMYGLGAEEVEIPGFKDYTPLMLAAAAGHADIVRMLAEAGANMQHRGHDFQQPAIHTAALNETLPAFLEFSGRLDLNQTDVDGWTALHHPTLSAENLKRLVRAGADIEAVNNDGDTPLMIAATHDTFDLERTKYLVQRGANIHHVSKRHGTPLNQACRTPNFMAIKYLMEKGADVNQTSYTLIGTPLQALCFKPLGVDPVYLEEIVRYLLDEEEQDPHVRPKERRADVSLEAGFFGFAISLAALTNAPNIINLILDQEGGTVDVRDALGRMPIHLAALNGMRNFEVILDRGGDIHVKDKMERSVLHWAAQGCCLQVVQKIISLLDDKTAIDAPDIDGWTPLCFAARGPASLLQEEQASEPVAQVAVIKLLMEHGANPNVVVRVGDEQWTPIKIARYYTAPAEVIPALMGDEATTIDGAAETKDKERFNAGEEGVKQKIGVYQGGWTCDGCLVEIRGYAWSCTVCTGMCFCFKCYNRVALIHPPTHGFTHGFTRNGAEEFEEGKDDDAASSSSSSSSSSSDSDSED